jgi:hypothetical protein
VASGLQAEAYGNYRTRPTVGMQQCLRQSAAELEDAQQRMKVMVSVCVLEDRTHVNRMLTFMIVRTPTDLSPERFSKT